MTLTPEEILASLKAVFTTFSDSVKFWRSRKCEKIVGSFLEQFKELVKRMDSSPQQEMQTFLNLLNSIMQTINAVLASDICH